MRSHLNTRVISVAGLLMLLAACMDGAVGPKPSTLPPGAPRPDIIMNSVAPDSLSADFTVTPSGGTFILGQHAVVFPANSICDPATTAYGPDQWDVPCTPVDTAVSFHAEIRGDSVGSAIYFTPSVRFVPTDDPNQYVWLLLKVPGAVNTSEPQRFPILWQADGSTESVDEAVSDPTLKTYLYAPGGIVFRRIKHFSVYNAWGQIFAELSDVVPVDY
jgi:hypothetical protein